MPSFSLDTGNGLARQTGPDTPRQKLRHALFKTKRYDLAGHTDGPIKMQSLLREHGGWQPYGAWDGKSLPRVNLLNLYLERGLITFSSTSFAVSFPTHSGVPSWVLPCLCDA